MGVKFWNLGRKKLDSCNFPASNRRFWRQTTVFEGRAADGRAVALGEAAEACGSQVALASVAVMAGL
jgi:uncharacterized protein YdiU (UPF0061 family)